MLCYRNAFAINYQTVLLTLAGAQRLLTPRQRDASAVHPSHVTFTFAVPSTRGWLTPASRCCMVYISPVLPLHLFTIAVPSTLFVR